MNTNTNMSNQNLSTQGVTQNVSGAEPAPDQLLNISQAEIDAFMADNPDLVNMDVNLDQLFADVPQEPAVQAAPSLLPPNTTGPYYSPDIQWHVKSTLPAMTPLPPPTDANFSGPFYAPEIGWHYKMLNAPGAQPMALMPIAMAQGGFTPSSATPFSSGMSTPVAPLAYMPAPPGFAPAVPKLKPARKRKYGPAAYLEKNAGATTSAPPRAVSISEAQYTSAAKRRELAAAEGISTPTGSRKKKYPSIVQACICSEKPAMKVKRPRNAFILYRSSRKDRIMKEMGSRNNHAVSSIAADMWKNESEAVKAQYRDMAEHEKARHRAEHPDYKYQPGLAERAKFGSASCTCGAYRINMNALIAKRSGGAMDLDVDFGDDDSGAYMPPRGYVAATQYTAPMPIMQPPPMPDPATFGFMPTQQAEAEAEAHINQLRRKRAADTMVEQTSNDPPLTKRLRSTNANYTFTEPDSPPAANTRSQSKARNSLTPPGTAAGGVGYTSFLQDAPPLDLGDFGDFDFDGDNIDVAPHPEKSGSQDSQTHSYSLRSRGGSKSPTQS